MHACSLIMTLMRMRAMDEIWIIDSGPGIAKSKDECYNWPIVWFSPADDRAQLLFPLHLDIIMVIFLCLKFLAFFPLRSFLSFECTSVCPLSLSLSSVLLTLRDCRQNLLKFVEGNFILYIHACRPNDAKKAPYSNPYSNCIRIIRDRKALRCALGMMGTSENRQEKIIDICCESNVPRGTLAT